MGGQCCAQWKLVHNRSYFLREDLGRFMESQAEENEYE